MLDVDAKKEKKVLLRTLDTNRFDWYSLFMVFLGTFCSASLIITITMSFKVAKMAGLNIGISQSIWSLSPFFVGLTDKYIYGHPFDRRKLLGMAAVVVCAICVSLSKVFESPKDGEAADPGDD